MSESPEADSYWARLAQQMQQERLRERADAAQDRAGRLQTQADEKAVTRDEAPVVRRRRRRM